MPLITLTMCGSAVPVLLERGGAIATYLTIGWVLGALWARTGFVITTEGAWLECRLLGIAWKSKPLGMHPAIDEVGPFGSSEIALVQRELARASGDHREVIAEWNDGDAARNADARILIDLLIAEIARLHGAPPSERVP